MLSHYITVALILFLVNFYIISKDIVNVTTGLEHKSVNYATTLESGTMNPD